jgi:hypothetical protein
MRRLAGAVHSQDVKANVSLSQHLAHLSRTPEMQSMIPPSAHDDLRLARRSQDRGIVAAPYGIFNQL